MSGFASVRSRFVGSARTLAFSALALAGAVIAKADPPTLPVPTASDYVGAGTGFLTAISPIITGLLPIGIGLMALMFAPKVLKRMVKNGASG